METKSSEKQPISSLRIKLRSVTFSLYTTYEGLSLTNQRGRKLEEYLAGSWRQATLHFVQYFHKYWTKLNKNAQMIFSSLCQLVRYHT